MANVTWLPEAIADIQRLHAFLKDKNPHAAMRAALVINAGAEILKGVLHAGKPMDDDSGRRELFLSFGASAYVLRYKIENEDTAVIIRVWHSREMRD
jgi:plasmid stabilization system protein ParE